MPWAIAYIKERLIIIHNLMSEVSSTPARHPKWVHLYSHVPETTTGLRPSPLIIREAVTFKQVSGLDNRHWGCDRSTLPLEGLLVFVFLWLANLQMAVTQSALCFWQRQGSWFISPKWFEDRMVLRFHAWFYHKKKLRANVQYLLYLFIFQSYSILKSLNV